MDQNIAGPSSTIDCGSQTFTLDHLNECGINSESDEEDVETLYDEDDFFLASQNGGSNEANNINSQVSSQTFDEVQHTENEEACSNIRQSRKRKKKPDSQSWQRNKLKKQRQSGTEYEGRKTILTNSGEKSILKVTKDARKMGVPCSSKRCATALNCREILETDRTKIFEKFWALNWKEKKLFVKTLVDYLDPVKRRNITSLDKEKTLHYHLPLNNAKKKVCRKLFLSTLSIKRGQVYNWIRESENSNENLPESLENQQILQESNDCNRTVGSNSNENATAVPKGKRISARKEFLESFFDRLPKMPSHYCRANSTKSYLEPVFQTKEDVRKLYNEECTKAQIKPLSRPMFEEVYNSLNIGLFLPKKDQCDECVKFKNGQKSSEAVQKYEQHLKRKVESRTSKDNDKASAIKKKCYTLCVDVEQVKLSPNLKASASYFKQKISSHNYTVYNMDTKHTMCYWWNETQGGLEASMFSSCLVHYLSEFCLSNSLPVIIYSDGCTSQNRNSVVSNALSHFSVSKNIEIYQKFLEKGHTQMEVDSVHSSIEAKLKGREIFVPSEYPEVSRGARKNPYEAKELTFDFFKNYKDTTAMQYSDIRPGTSRGDPVVTNLRVLKYTPDGKIHFKINYSDDFKELPNKRKCVAPLPSSFPTMYQENLNIFDKCQGFAEVLVFTFFYQFL